MPGTDLRAGGKDDSWAGRPFICLGLSLPKLGAWTPGLQGLGELGGVWSPVSKGRGI